MFLLFDIGATNTRIGYSADGQALAGVTILPTPANFAEAIAQLAAAGHKLTKGRQLQAAAGGIAGPLNNNRTAIVNAPNLAGWNNQPLKSELAKAWSAPVYLENDTAMIGLGEATGGVARNKNIVAYVTVSTGIGGAQIIGGKIAPHAWGFEPGHQIIISDGPPCACGGAGHLEALIGGAALQKKYQKSPAQISDPAIWLDVANYLAIGLNNILVLWSPDIIVLGGSVMKSIDLNTVRQKFKEVATIFPELPSIELATLGEEGGLYGALSYLNNLPAT